MKKFANSCYDSFISAKSKIEALTVIASRASEEYVDFFGPYILDNFDRISINFIELLDQVIFEVERSNFDSEDIDDYIIDDLHQRISIYIEIYIGLETYRLSLFKRVMRQDDMMIFSHYGLIDYIPDIITEFHEQPNLKFSCLRALISFDEEELLSLFYQIVKDVHSLEIKTIALAGLKKYGKRFNNWEFLKNSDSELSDLVEYIEIFNIEKIHRNRLPDNKWELLFSVMIFELNMDNHMNDISIKWIFRKIGRVVELADGNSNLSNIYESLSNIFINFNNNRLAISLRDSGNLISFVNLLDLLPSTLFNRVAIKLDSIGPDFIESVKELYSRDKDRLENTGSNFFNYFLLEDYKNF